MKATIDDFNKATKECIDEDSVMIRCKYCGEDISLYPIHNMFFYMATIQKHYDTCRMNESKNEY